MRSQQRFPFRPAMAVAALAAGLSSAPAVSAEDHLEVSGNVALTSDYRFRGVSQSDRDLALQGGFDIAFDSGFYVGTWGSSVDFGDDVQMELDVYGGYAGELDNGIGYDVFFIRYEYPNASYDYNELGFALSMGDFSGGVIFSNQYLDLDDVVWFYPYVDYSRSLGENTSLDLHVGWSLADDKDMAFEGVFGDDKYLDWSVGVTHSLAGIDFGLAYVDTDIDEDVGGDAADSALILSIGKSL